ncbi:hypothetical protein D3C80_1664600 [compost metagenome]
MSHMNKITIQKLVDKQIETKYGSGQIGRIVNLDGVFSLKHSIQHNKYSTYGINTLPINTTFEKITLVLVEMNTHPIMKHQ